jgi:ribosomal protein L11 methyltransferase
VDWQQFVMNLEALDPAAIEVVFLRNGACSVTLSDAGDNPVLEPGPGETPLWADTRITGLFPQTCDLRQLEADLLSELGVTALPPHHIEDLEDRAWEREWLKDFGPMRFGSRLWVCPGSAALPEKGAVVIRLDPGLAFGTGTHATTALCLEWLDALSLQGMTVLDYGCGSGILAVAALKLGCSAATAIDNDSQAVMATRQNALKNAVADRLHVQHSAQPVEGTFDVVVANILAGPLMELAEQIAALLSKSGILALSGVLSEQAVAVMAAYEPWIDFAPAVFREQDGQIWSRLSGTRR